MESRVSIDRLGQAALQLRLCGASFADIADTLELDSPRHALSLVTRELNSEVSDADRSMLREEENQRLLTLLGPVMNRAMNQNDPEHLAAARAALAIVDRRIRLLGLDAPVQIAVHTPSAAELEAWVSRQAAIDVPSIEEFDVLAPALPEGEAAEEQSWATSD